MNIITNRLKIRDLSSGDIDNIHTLHSLPETDRFNTLGIPESTQTTEKLVAEWLTARNTLPRASYIYSIELIDSDQFALKTDQRPEAVTNPLLIPLKPTGIGMGHNDTE